MVTEVRPKPGSPAVAARPRGLGHIRHSSRQLSACGNRGASACAQIRGDGVEHQVDDNISQVWVEGIVPANRSSVSAQRNSASPLAQLASWTRLDKLMPAGVVGDQIDLDGGNIHPRRHEKCAVGGKPFAAQ
jgi:hypothetical protein